MLKNEISEIKKRLTKDRCSISRICGCYVDGEKNKRAIYSDMLLSMADEDFHKYLEILKKCLSGRMNKNLLNIEFPLSAEGEGTVHQLMLGMRESGLKNEALMDIFYDKIIENYATSGNYLILSAIDSYDVPGRASDNLNMEDASEEVFTYMIFAVCPVELAKPSLSFHENEGRFLHMEREWIAQAPEFGFMFPSFTDRTTDIHSMLYYIKDAKDNKPVFIENMFGAKAPATSGEQADAFGDMLQQIYGEELTCEVMKEVHEQLNIIAEEKKETKDPDMSMTVSQVKEVLRQSGAPEEGLSQFTNVYEKTAGQTDGLTIDNIYQNTAFRVKTPDVQVKVSADRTDLIETRVIDGRKYLLVALEGSVEVNGIEVN